MSIVQALRSSPLRNGRVTWIGLRPARGATMIEVAEASAIEGAGLEGDRWRGRSTGKRQVTLIQQEHLPLIGSFLGQPPVHPSVTRRNIVVQGINLIALKGRRFQIGGAVFEGSGACAPCSKMEQALGQGGYAAMRGHGGITARVVTTGTLARGDEVKVLPDPDAQM